MAAKQRGVRFGRPAKLAPEQITLAQRLLEEGTAADDVAWMFKVHRAILYRALATIPAATRSSSAEEFIKPSLPAACS